MTTDLPSLVGVTVLVVDDDEATRYVWSRHLTRAGASVRAVQDAEHALPILEREGIDVLLIDIVLPGIDGYQLLTRAALRPRVAIAITAFDDAQQQARARRAGFDAYLAKPIDPTALIQEIAHCMGR